MEKKEINIKTTVSSIILGFASYSIIVSFIIFVLLCLTNNFLNNFNGTSSRGLYITLPLITVILLYFIIRGICKLSIYDVFKKAKVNPKNYKKIAKYLNIFFIICIIIYIYIFWELLALNLIFQTKTIEYTIIQYKEIFSEEHTSVLAKELIDIYNFSKTNLIISTAILVIGISVSILSLIPYQRKLIEQFNEYKENTTSNS